MMAQSGRPTPKPVRCRSLDIQAPLGVETLDILNLLSENRPLAPFRNDIEAVFQIGRDLFNITVKENTRTDAIRARILEMFNKGIKTAKGVLELRMPRRPNTRINIRAIPVEIPDEIVKNTLEKYGIGRIIKVERVYHKGTRIFNGYRTVVVEEYRENRLPQFVRFMDTNCKVFLPPGEYQEVKRCNKCLEVGHEMNQCPNQTVCLHCKQKGHKRLQCPQREMDFPQLGKKNTTENDNEPRPEESKSKDTPATQTTSESSGEMILVEEGNNEIEPRNEIEEGEGAVQPPQASTPKEESDGSYIHDEPSLGTGNIKGLKDCEMSTILGTGNAGRYVQDTVEKMNKRHRDETSPEGKPGRSVRKKN